MISKNEEEPAIVEQKIPGIMFYLSYKIISRNLALLTFIWAAVSFNMGMLALHVKHIPGDFETN